MQNPIRKLEQSSIVFDTTGILSEKWKILTSSNHVRVKYFLLKFCSRFLITSVYKRMFGINFIVFRFWVISKNKKKTRFLHTYWSHFCFLLITQDLNKILKNPEQSFAGIVKLKMSAKFQQKIWNSMVVDTYQSWYRCKYFFFHTNNLVSRIQYGFV